MASLMPFANDGHGGDVSTAMPDTSEAEAALRNRLSRKRTKTGCLTCRKRRIKCGEEKPLCRNCVKSKRQCGYSHPVVFTSPPNDFHPVPHGGAHITFQAGPVPTHITATENGFGQPAVSQTFHNHALPPRLEQGGHVLGPTQPHYSTISQNPPMIPDFQQQSQSITPAQQTFIPRNNHYPPRQDSLHYGPSHEPAFGHPQHLQANGVQRPIIQHGTPLSASSDSQVSYQALWQHPYSPAQERTLHAISPNKSVPGDRVSPTSAVSSKTVPWSYSSAALASATAWAPPAYTPRPELCRPIDYQPPSAPQALVPPVQLPRAESAPEHSIQHSGSYGRPGMMLSANGVSDLLNEAAVESQDDDYYDVQSDEEMDIDTLAMTTRGHERQRELHDIMERNNISVEDLQSRRFEAFMYHGILDRYRIENAANPLNNPATARVFMHFISVTGPLLSIFERHPRNASVLYTEGQIPFSQQGLWTYAMPVAALHHQGLLHAMLALGSLHIARLQGASDTPSRMHYAWACKRLNHLLRPTSKKRHKTTTIAASMLLGFYEIVTADHKQWNLHLTGSKQLFLETDFVAMTQQFRRMKADRAARQQFGPLHPNTSAYEQAQDETLDQIPDVDEHMIGHLAGRDVRYEDDGQAMTLGLYPNPGLDLSNFEILRDLYWWYLKQDVYGSIVSGNALLLDYNRWPNCPPRAPLGKADAVYGSFDHLILLLGRIADFSSKDRRRKLKQMEVNGNQWKPAPGMQVPVNPQPQQARNGPTQGQPAFFGMAPPPKQHGQVPASYQPLHNGIANHVSEAEENIDLHTATQAALEEYGRIRGALHAFVSSLGKEFEPLSEEYQPPLDTPFGPALFYRSYDIACLLAVYNMAMIIAIRSHPHMHPAAHVAAGIAAQETAHFANVIGRINAAISPGPSTQAVNPALAAALHETCMPAFFAAVQYQSPHQRYATVMRIHNIALRTGWGTAELIANGCETAWVKAAEAGRGPPYTRIARPEYSDDPRLSAIWDDRDPFAGPNETHENDRRMASTDPAARLTWAIGILGMEDDEKPRAA